MKRDQKFFDLYSVVIGGLAIFALAIFVLAMKMSKLTQDVYNASSEEFRESVEDRIRPFGEVYLPGEELDAGAPLAPAAEEAAPVQAALTGAQVFNQACNVCHGNGIGGAPMLTDSADWEPRIAQGNETLQAHAVDGFAGSVGFMPPKGGNADLSEAQVRAAVEFMTSEVAKY